MKRVIVRSGVKSTGLKCKTRTFTPIAIFTMTDSPATTRLITDQTLSRSDLASLLAGEPQQGLRFERCDFDGQDLSRLNLRGAEFQDCTLAEASLERCDLAQTQWLACKARQANFHLADLTDASFSRCDLNNSTWGLTKLAGVSFIEVKLTGANFKGAHQTLGLRFQDSLLVDADLRGLSFRKQTIARLNLADADLGGCDFRDAVFEGGSLRDANLKNAQFEGADLRSVDLSGLTITNVAQQFKGATLSMEQAAALISGLGVRVM